MKAKIINLLTSPFFVLLPMGIVGVIIPILELQNNTPRHLVQLLFGLVTGIGLGLGVFGIERSIYFRRYHKRKMTSEYKTTDTWKFVYSFLLLLIVVLNNLKVEATGYVVVFASGVYLLTLAAILFRVRKNNQIKVI